MKKMTFKPLNYMFPIKNCCLLGIYAPDQRNVYEITSPKILEWLETCDNISWTKITGFTKTAYALSKDLEVMMKLKFSEEG